MNAGATPFTFITIGITAVVSFAAFSSRSAFRTYSLSPYQVVRGGKWFQVVSSGFLHADLGHLFFNMFTLFFFGRPIELYLGGVGFLVVYLGSMIAGSLLGVLRHYRDPNYRAVGASGGVSGIIFGFILFQPFAKIYVFLVPVGIPAFLFAFGYVAISIYGMRTRMGRIGHDAHLGGAVAGIVLTIILFPQAIRHFLSHFG
jgi:membrane associated rhomboid family serine protease